MSQNSLGFPRNILKQNMQLRKYDVMECFGVSLQYMYFKCKNADDETYKVMKFCDVSWHESTTVDFKKMAIREAAVFVTIFQ